MNIIIIGIMGIVISLLGLLYSKMNYKRVFQHPRGTPEMKSIHEAIKSGANTFLICEYKVILAVVVIIFVLECLFIFTPSAIAFLFGVIMSALAGFIGMRSATMANVRVANQARNKKTIGRTLNLALRGGSIMGLCLSSLSLIGLIIILFIFREYIYDVEPITNWVGIEFTPISMIVTSYALGCSILALFNRVGGGIFTKAADMGADLVGKTEEGIPEDDPRNPAVIADSVGDNVGDVAGLGSDLLESNVSSIVGGIITPIFIYLGFQARGLSFSMALLEKLIFYPIGISALGLFACIISLNIVLAKKDHKNPHFVLNLSTWLSAILTAIFSLALTFALFGGQDLGDLPFILGIISPWLSLTIGIIAGVLVGFTAEYYTSSQFRPTMKIVKASKSGPALNITSGISVSMKSTLVMCVILGTAMYLSYFLSGIYGICIASVGMLSFVSITASVDTYGPIADNAGGIAEMAELDEGVRAITDELDAVGNTTAAVGKGFAIGSATFTTISLLISYLYSYTPFSEEVVLNIVNPQIFFGALVGASLICYFSGMLIETVSISAEQMIAEVRRQFQEIKGLRDNNAKPDYNQCIKIATTGALSGMKMPALVAVFVPTVFGFVFGPNFVGGLLFGAILTATILAIFYGNSGGAWDNAKKYIESKSKGSDAHVASVIGDTVGDPFKDTAGPSLNIFIKIMSTVSLLLVYFFKNFHIF